MEVKPGEKVKCETGAEKYLHLSQASLGETKKDKGNASVPVYLHVNGKKLVISTLSHDKCPQVAYDFVFEKDFELSHGWKDGSVFFVGYKTIIGDEPDDFSDTSDEEEEEVNVQPAAKDNGKPAKKENVAAKPTEAAKAKGKPEAAAKPPAKEDEDDEEDDESDDSDEEGESEDMSDEDMADGDNSDDDDEDESSEEEEEEKITPKKDKKRPADAKTPVTDNKKAKVVTPAGKTGGADAKKVPHAATPYPKQAGKTPATAGDKSKQQTPKSGGNILCKTCNKGFGSDAALQSHTKAKHSS